MKLTALEIRKHEFKRAFRGYDAEEVDAFLNMVAQHWQTTSQDMARLEERLEEQTLRVNHYLKVEEALEAALDNAKTLSKDRLEAATAEADERVQTAKEEAEGTLTNAERRAADAVRSAEAKASETLGSAESQAAATVQAANERANAVLSDARSQLVEITELAEAARRSARKDLEHLESERQRLLTSLKELLDGGLASVSIYEDAVPPPQLAEFEAARPLVPVEALHRPMAMAAVLPAAVEPSAPKVLRLEETDHPAEMDEAAESESLHAGEEDAATEVDEAGPVEDETQGGPEDETQAGLDDEPKGGPDDVECEQSPVLTLSDSGHEDYIDDLPSADDVVADEGSPASAPAAAMPAEDAPFAAKDEIKKIHRILEDLDN